MATITVSKIQPILDRLAEVDFDIEADPGSSETAIAAYNENMGILKAELPGIICMTNCIVEYLSCLQHATGYGGAEMCKAGLNSCITECGGTV